MAECSEIEAGGEIRTIKDTTARQGVATNTTAIEEIIAKIPASASASNQMTTAADLANKQDKINGLGNIYATSAQFSNLESGVQQSIPMAFDLPAGSYIFYMGVLLSTNAIGSYRFYASLAAGVPMSIPLSNFAAPGNNDGAGAQLHDAMPVALPEGLNGLTVTLIQGGAQAFSGQISILAQKMS